MPGMLIVFKPIKFEDFTFQNRKLNNGVKILVRVKRNQKNGKG